MKEYTAKQIKQLEKNPYVFKVTKHMIYYTAKFKEDFWVSYQAGNTPRKRRILPKPTDIEELAAPQSIERMQNELLYLRQEVEFLKKIIIADNSRKKK